MWSESPGTVAVPMSEIGRFALFTVSLAGTRQPSGSRLSVMASASVTENLNSMISFLPDESEWIWIVGDDHCWENDCLMRLLEAMDETPIADIMVPLVVKRNPPWHLVIFHADGERDDGMPRWRPYGWDEIPESGTFEIDAAGSAGMLITRQCLDAFGEGPWFRSTGGVVLNEDVTFCRDAREMGFRIFASADVQMGHIGLFNVRPMRKNGRWGAMTEFASPDERFQSVFMPDIEEPHAAALNGR